MQLVRNVREKSVFRATWAKRQRHNSVEPPEGRVGKTSDGQKHNIEETQDALRESIEQAKHLADKAQLLLQKHNKTIDRQPD